MRPGIPQTAILILKKESLLFYSSGNTLFKFKICEEIDAFTFVFSEKNDTIHTDTIRSISYDNGVLITSGDDKLLALFDKNLVCIRKKRLTKKIAAAYGTGEFILISDRFGDIYRINKNLLGDLQFFFSHYTTITTSLIINFLYFSGDKDGKIVILDLGNPFIIKKICLGHCEFIASIAPFGDDKFISLSADGHALIWRLSNFSKILHINLQKIAIDQYGDGWYTPFQLIPFNSTSFYAIFSNPNTILQIDCDTRERNWIELPFRPQAGTYFQTYQALVVVDMSGFLWRYNNKDWIKIDQPFCHGKLVNFYKENEKLKSRIIHYN